MRWRSPVGSVTAECNEVNWTALLLLLLPLLLWLWLLQRC
jgi:hypothetical protein